MISISIAFGVNSKAYGDNSKGYGFNSASLGDRNHSFKKAQSQGCESLGIGLPEFVLYGRSCLRCLYHIGFRYFKALPSEKALPTFSPTFR